jgi:hypothetical protein
MNSIWFRLFLYTTSGHGPVSVLCAQGTRLHGLPSVLQVRAGTRKLRAFRCDRRTDNNPHIACMIQPFDDLLVTPWNQEGQVMSSVSALSVLNDLLSEGAVLIQGYAKHAMDHDDVQSVENDDDDATSLFSSDAQPQLADLPLPILSTDAFPGKRKI